MSFLPPMPTVDSAHPIVVHFPIALLLVAPVYLVMALVMGRRGAPFMVSALVLMVLGTIGAFVAVYTGEAAAELAERAPGVADALEHHEELAEQSRTFFTAMTVVLAVIVIVPRFVAKLRAKRWIPVAATILFLGVYAGAAILLANTAHAGGRLVHEYGVHALLPVEPGSPPASPGAHRIDHDDDD